MFSHCGLKLLFFICFICYSHISTCIALQWNRILQLFIHGEPNENRVYYYYKRDTTNFTYVLMEITVLQYIVSPFFMICMCIVGAPSACTALQIVILRLAEVLTNI